MLTDDARGDGGERLCRKDPAGLRLFGERFVHLLIRSGFFLSVVEVASLAAFVYSFSELPSASADTLTMDRIKFSSCQTLSGQS